MGQKINPNIFRLGVNKKWKTEFFEKTPKEFANFTSIDLEIQSYIERFLYIHGLSLHSYKINYSDLIINIYISYAVFSSLKLNKIKHNKIKLIETNSNKKIHINNEKVIKHNNKNKLLLKAKNYLNLKNFNNNKSKEVGDNFFKYNIENKIKKMIEVLLLFKKKKIVINFNCINKFLTLDLKQKKSLKKKIMLLRKFENSEFFKEGINLIFISVFKTNSSKILTNFISIQLKKIKKQKFFMAFLKKSLTLFINSEFSRIKGVRIKIKGRLNGVPRAKHKIINIGDLPVQTITSSLSYSESETYNSTGSFGIKVWIINKNTL